MTFTDVSKLLEFNEHQRDVFCVFSGAGVKHLRLHLEEKYADPTSESDTDSHDGHMDIIQNTYQSTLLAMFGPLPSQQAHHSHGIGAGPFNIHTTANATMFMGPLGAHTAHHFHHPNGYHHPLPPPPPLMPLLMAHPAVGAGGGVLAVEDEGDEDLEEGDAGVTGE